MNLATLNRDERRSLRRAFEQERLQQSDTLTEVPRHTWPEHLQQMEAAPIRVWRSKTFLVHLYAEGESGRLSIIRALWPSDNGWQADITWDELMECKRQIGYGDAWAVECLPPSREVVNVANMRHLWLLDNAPESYGWKR